jgi:membrane protease YdiL (CAAX protease family)
VLWFFVLALGATAVLHGAIAVLDLPYSLAGDSAATPLYLFGLVTPALAAVLLSRGSGETRFVRTALQVQGSVSVYVLALLAQAGFLAGAWCVSKVVGEASTIHMSVANDFVLVAVGQIWVVVGEELGWRAFALPRLERLVSPIAATVVLALAWGAWHTPMFFVSGSPQAKDPVWLFASAIFAWSCVHTALYQRAMPSIVPNLAFHASANITLNLVVVPDDARAFLAAAYTVGGLATLVAIRRASRVRRERVDSVDTESRP